MPAGSTRPSHMLTQPGSSKWLTPMWQPLTNGAWRWWINLLLFLPWGGQFWGAFYGTPQMSVLGREMTCPEIHVKSLDSMNVILFGKRVIADVIKLWILRWGEYPGLSKWALIPMTSVFLRARQRKIWDRQKKRQTQRRRWCEDTAEGGTATAQKCQQPPEAGTGKERFFSRNFSGNGPADTLISDFYPIELWKNTFPLF